MMSRACSAWFGLVIACLMMLQETSQVRAEVADCSSFATSIIQMEGSPARPTGWRELDHTLRYLYAEQCVLKPTRTRATEYWFRADGTPLGVKADFTPPGWDPTKIYQPEEGAFMTSPQIAAECARVTSMTPSVCAMLKGVEAACLKPIDSEQRTQCEAILNGRVPDLPAAADELPPLADVLKSATSGPPRLDDAAVAADPGFQRMCAAANSNFNQCTVRRRNMSSIDGPGTGGTGQAGAFYECQKLYSGVLAMCRSVGVTMPGHNAIAVPSTPTAAQKPGNASGQSAPPPKPATSTMSPKCQELVSNYVSAAQSGNGANSVAGYNALKAAGGCGVLAKVDRPLSTPTAPVIDDSLFESRGARANTDSVFDPCDHDPAGCAAKARQLRAATSAEAQALVINNAIAIGLQLGTLMGGAVLSGVPAGGSFGGGGSNMNSIGNRPIRSAPGQGSPAFRPPPPSHQSDITGTK